MPSGAVLRQWIGLDVTECPSHLCMSCKLYRPAHFWKNILSCCSKDVKLVTYDVRWRQFVLFFLFFYGNFWRGCWTLKCLFCCSSGEVSLPGLFCLKGTGCCASRLSLVHITCVHYLQPDDCGANRGNREWHTSLWLMDLGQPSLYWDFYSDCVIYFFYLLYIFFWHWLMDPSRLGR